MEEKKKQIGIIGAGISGLLACKYMLSKGFDSVVFEARSGVGGVWIKTVETTKLQSPKPLYQFSDFPWPFSVTEDFPTQHQVFDYIQSYAQHFDLIKHIRFNTKVPFHGEGKWKIVVQDNLNNSTELYIYIYKIACVTSYICRFSDVPNMPEFPPKKGPKAFRGKVIHSMDYAAMDYQSAANFVKGKQVTVFSELLVHKPGQGFLLALLATMLSPLRWGFSKFVESDIKKKHRLAKYGMVPKLSFLEEISSCLTATLPEKFYDKGILVDGGDTEVTTMPLKTDLVTLATRYRGDKKLKDIFVSQTFQDFIEIIHLQIPQLTVIGFSKSLSNLYTSEMRNMENDMAEWDRYMKRYSGKYYRRSYIWYNDQLCKDMGWNPKRKNGFFTELFEPYGPFQYLQRAIRAAAIPYQETNL
ncbi:hypothetical protein ACOSQ4_006044 [Xanthoceras sorbifolium]